MKTSLFFAAGMLIAAIATGQNQELIAIEVTSPAFRIGASESVDDFLQKHVEYPTESHRWKLQGTEVVQFVVTNQGKLSDYKVINSVSAEIDKEVIRLLELTSGMWSPGTINGEPVDMEKEVSLEFKISQNSDFIEMAKWNMQKGNELLFLRDQPKKAIKYFDLAVNYLPNNETIHAVRGYCKYRMGDENGADRDWERANILAERQGLNFDFKNLALNANNLEVFKGKLNYVEK
jgi:tetratricopeptide (TPR) repeat protein